METLSITIPVGEVYTAGDYADVYVNDVKLNNSPLAFFPGQATQDGLMGGRFMGAQHLDSRPRGGLFGGGLFDGLLGEPGQTITVTTPCLYHGLKEVRVKVFDHLGNASPGDPAEVTVFLHTGPTAPKNLRFQAQQGSGPVTFEFRPSVELAV
ncbi:MAG: hypothetical protein KAV82_01015 [Phycisphaerae bacterium]|nr:hypothetical protein [Phycisphaerae bacterium]